MNVSNRPGMSMAALTGGDAAATAAIIAEQDAEKSKQQARASRDCAHRDQIATMKSAADKLRDMAESTRSSGWYQAGAGLVSAGLSALGVSYGDKTEKYLQAGARLVDGGAKYDYWALRRDEQTAEKAELDTESAAAGHRAENASEMASSAQRHQTAAIRQLEKMLEAQGAMGRAATRL